jgi:DNA-binding NarL/FixJ family response regulator
MESSHLQNTAGSVEVLVSDADNMTARLLAADLRRQGGFRVHECSNDPLEISRRITSHQISVLLLGLGARDPICETLEMLRAIHTEFPEVRGVILAQTADSHLVIESFRSGAKGFFDRASYDPVMLSRCVHCVASGQIWARSDQLSMILDAFVHGTKESSDHPRGVDLLTPREREVADCVKEGLSNNEIAERLGLSIQTVKNYLFNVFDKLGVSNRAELIIYLFADRQERSVGEFREIIDGQERIYRHQAGVVRRQIT